MTAYGIEPYTGKTPLMVLLERGDEDGALRLLVPNSNTQLAAAHEVDAVDRWESTALHYAAMWGCDRVAQRLLALRAMPQRRNGAGLSALDLAAKWDHDTTFEVLLRGEGLADFGGWTPQELFDTLITTSKQDNPCPDLLLERPELGIRQFGCALGCATQLGRHAVVEQLLERFSSRSILLLPFTWELQRMIEVALGDATEGDTRGSKKSRPKDKSNALSEVTIPERGPPPSLGEALLYVALRNDAHEIATLLCRHGADPGFDVARDPTLASERKPFGLALSKSAFEAASTMLPAAFLKAPAQTLFACMRISAVATRRAAAEAVRDPPKAFRFKSEALKAELSALALLQALSEKRQMDLLRSDLGVEFIRLAARQESVIVLSQPIIICDMQSQWFGGLLQLFLTARGCNPWGEAVALSTATYLTALAYFLFVAIPLNLLLLPACALFPPLRGRLLMALRGLGDEGEVDGKRREAGYCNALKMWWEESLILEVPFFKAWLRHLTNMTFAVVLITRAGPSAFRLAWASSMLVSSISRMLAYEKIFIKWSAWMLLAASTLLCLGLSFELLMISEQRGGAVEPSVQQGIVALGLVLLNLDTVAGIFLQSLFFGPMVLSITQMMRDMFQWLVISLSVAAVFSIAMLIKSAGLDDFDFSTLFLFFANVGTKVSPLLGPAKLLVQPDQDIFDFIFLQGNFIIGAVMLYSMLTAVFATRLTKDDATRVPAYQKGFSKLVINERLQPPVPPPLHALGLPLQMLLALPTVSGTRLLGLFRSRRTDRSHAAAVKTGRGLPQPELKPTPESRWHSLDFLAKYSFDELTAHVKRHLSMELVKREGALKAVTADAKFKALEAEVDALRAEATATRQALESAIDALNRPRAPTVLPMSKEVHGGAEAASEAAPEATPSLSTNNDVSTKGEGDGLASAAVDRPRTASSEKFIETQHLQYLPDGTFTTVRAFGGFSETAVRLVYPYGEHFAERPSSRKVYHMTILKDGVVENEKKRLYLGGQFDDSDRDDLRAMTVKKLKEELKEHSADLAASCADDEKDKLIQLLMGKPRDVKLNERALCAFPMLQTIPLAKALPHLAQEPNNKFIVQRDNGECGVVHCWPIKFNAEFKKRFRIETYNFDPSKFSPRMATEMKACMQALFDEDRGQSLGALISGCLGGTHGGAKLHYCSATSWNKKTILSGTASELVAFLRQHPKLQQAMNIVKLEPDGFTARIKIKGMLQPKEKEFHMASTTGREEHTVYIKQGYEEMACVKPLDLFKYDCEFGPELTIADELYVDHDQPMPKAGLQA